MSFFNCKNINPGEFSKYACGSIKRSSGMSHSTYRETTVKLNFKPKYIAIFPSATEIHKPGTSSPYVFNMCIYEDDDYTTRFGDSNKGQYDSNKKLSLEDASRSPSTFRDYTFLIHITDTGFTFRTYVATAYEVSAIQNFYYIAIG